MPINSCDKCGGKKITVVDSRDRVDWIFRRRRCGDCDYRFTTREVREDDFKLFANGRRHKNFESVLQEIIRAYFKSLAPPEQMKFIEELTHFEKD